MCVCVFFRAVEMGSEMSQTVRFNILKVIDGQDYVFSSIPVIDSSCQPF